MSTLFHQQIFFLVKADHISFNFTAHNQQMLGCNGHSDDIRAAQAGERAGHRKVPHHSYPDSNRRAAPARIARTSPYAELYLVLVRQWRLTWGP